MSLVQLPITFPEIEAALEPLDAEACAWVRNGDKKWNKAIAAELRPILKAIYQLDVTKAQTNEASFAVVIKKYGEPKGKVIACALLSFSPYPDNAFNVYCEGVHPDFRNSGVGTTLYKAISRAADNFVRNDPFVRLNLLGESSYDLVVCIDTNKPNTEALERFVGRQGFELGRTTREELMYRKVVGV